MRKHTCTVDEEAASTKAGSTRKRNRPANRTARKTRSGSSKNVWTGSIGVRIKPSARSCRPREVKSSISHVRKLKNRLLMVKSRRFASSSGVPSRISGMRVLWSVYTSVLRPQQSMDIPKTWKHAVSKCLDCCGFLRMTPIPDICAGEQEAKCLFTNMSANCAPLMVSKAKSISEEWRRMSLSRTQPPAALTTRSGAWTAQQARMAAKSARSDSVKSNGGGRGGEVQRGGAAPANWSAFLLTDMVRDLTKRSKAQRVTTSIEMRPTSPEW